MGDKVGVSNIQIWSRYQFMRTGRLNEVQQAGAAGAAVRSAAAA